MQNNFKKYPAGEFLDPRFGTKSENDQDKEANNPQFSI